MPNPQQAFLVMLLAGPILAVSAAVPVGAIYLRIRPVRLLCRPMGWRIPWSGYAVALSFGLAIILPFIATTILNSAGFFAALYGPGFPAPATSAVSDNQLAEQASHLRGLWSTTIAAPLIIAMILLTLRFGARTTPAQIGLGTRRFGSSIILGYLSWLVLTPIVMVVFALARITVAPNPREHPLLNLGPWAGRLEIIIFAAQAGVLMPIIEEMLFRGILLPWSIQRKPFDDAIVPPPYRAHLCYAVGLLMSLQIGALTVALRHPDSSYRDLLSALAPSLFLLALMPVFIFLPGSRRIQRWLGLPSAHTLRGWFANGALFASAHSSVWPTPIPLFILGLGLAWLALRSRSIVPCIVVHGLFNGLAVVFVMIGG